MRIKYIDFILFLIGTTFLLYSFQLIVGGSEAVKYLIYCTRLMIGVFSFIFIMKYQKRVVLIFAPIFIFYLLYGMFNGNWINFLFQDLLIALLLMFIFLFSFKNRDHITKRIIDLLSLLLLFSSVAAIYYFAKNGLEAATSVENRLNYEDADESFSIKSTFQVLQLSLVLLPFSWFVDSKRKIIILFGLFVYFTVNLMILSRVGIAITFISLGLTILIGIKEKFIKPNFKLASFFILLIFLSSFIFDRIGDEIKILASFAAERFQEIDIVSNVETNYEEPRDKEASEYFGSLEPHQFIIGKGMGAANPYPFGKYTSGKGMMMMHRGENNLIMKGGWVLLLIIYGSAIYAIVRLAKARTKFGYSYLSVILIYLLMERGHQQLSQFFMLFFLSLAISYAFSIKSFKINKYKLKS
jgi:hypothetical protein